MTRIFGMAMLALAALALPAAGRAQDAREAEPVCVMAAPPPPELVGWAARVPLAAAVNPRGLAKAALVVGAAIDATLQPIGKVRYVAKPEKPGKADSYGGLYVLVVTRPGTYRIALGDGAWIDLLKGKKPIASTAHGHGPICTGIRKMVDFSLERGRHVLQIAGSPGSTIPVMVARLP